MKTMSLISQCTKKIFFREILINTRRENVIIGIALQWEERRKLSVDVYIQKHITIHTHAHHGESVTQTPVSLSLLHRHTCFIYEANMRHIQDKYAAFMMQIFIIFFKK